MCIQFATPMACKALGVECIDDVFGQVRIGTSFNEIVIFKKEIGIEYNIYLCTEILL